MKIKLNYARQLWLSLLLLVGVAAIAVPGLNGTNSDNVAEINGTGYATLEAAVDAAGDGATIQVIKAGEYAIPAITKNLKIEATVEGVAVKHEANSAITTIASGKTATFKNITFNLGTLQLPTAHGFGTLSGSNGALVMDGCTINGALNLFGESAFTNCKFNAEGIYNIWAVNDNATFTGCTFTNTNRAVNVYDQKKSSTTKDVSFSNCTFAGSAKKKAAVNIHHNPDPVGAAAKYAVSITNCTTSGTWASTVEETGEPDGNTICTSALWMISDIVNWEDGDISVTVDGVAQDVSKFSPVAKIGETKYTSLQAAVAAAEDGATIQVIKAGEYAIPAITEDLTIEATVEGVAVKHEANSAITTIASGKTATFKNITFNLGTLQLPTAHGFGTLSGSNGALVMDGCTINGALNLFGESTFTNCNFNAEGIYNIWAVNDNATFTGCTFTNTNRAVNVYNQKKSSTTKNVSFSNCTFAGSAKKKAAVNIHHNADPVGTAAKYAVSINDCTTSGTWASTVGETGEPDEKTICYSPLWMISDIVNWEDGDITVTVNGEAQDVSKFSPVAKIGETKYTSLQAALDAAEAEDIKNVVIDLLGDATLDITAWSGTKNPLSIGTVNTESITINGNGKKLTFNQKDSDWNNIATMNDDVTKLILNNMAITNGGHNDGPWNRHDINFNCAVELNNVTSDKALAFKNDASLKNVTVTETGDVYAIWVQPKGQNISIDGLTINATEGRGIKIDDQYVETTAEQVTMSIANATFNTKNKSAILVKSAANTVITAGEDINIENVASDKENLVWVDEDRAEEFYKVAVAGAASVVPESKESDYVACLMNGEQRWGFYKELSKAINNVEEGYSIKLHKTTTEAVEVSKQLTITKNGFTADNVTAADGFVREETETEIIIRELDPVAKIGDVTYKTLQKALDAAHEMTVDVTITLLDDITGYSIVHQKAGLNLTIDGADKKVSGNIIVDGDGRASGTETLTIKNIKFEGDGTNFCSGTSSFVEIPSCKTAGTPYYTDKYNYAHNVTVTNCSFTSTTSGLTMAAVRATSGAGAYNVAINECTGTNLHSLAQLLGTTGGSFTNNTVDNSDSFVNLNGGDGEFTVSGNTFTSSVDDGYGIRENEASTAIITLTDNIFTAGKAVVLGKGAKKTNGTINVISGTYVGDIVKDIAATATGKIVISGGKFSAPLGNSAYAQFIAEGKTGVNGLYPEEEQAKNGLGEAVVTITDSEGKVTNYAKLESAFADAKDGDTVKPLVDITELASNITVGGTHGDSPRVTTAVNPVNVTFDLNGKTIKSDKTIYLVGGSLNITGEGTIETTGSGVSPVGVRYQKDANHSDLDYTSKRTLTIGENVTLKGVDYGLNIFGSNEGTVANNIEVNINGNIEGTTFVLGNLSNTDNNIVVNVNSGASLKGKEGIALNGFATVNVADNTTIEGTELGIEVRAGNLNVAGGTITSTATEYTVKSNGDGSAAKGAAISVAQHTTGLPISTNITGCTLTGVKTISVADPENGNLAGVTVKVADALANAETVIIPVAYKWVSDGTMSTLTPRDPVAKIDETVYYSLADAVAAVPTDGTEKTITLLADVTENVAVSGGKNIVLDLGEKTLTGYIDLYDSELNVKNGNVAGTVYVNGGPASAEAGYNKFTLANNATITADYGIILYQAEGTTVGYGSTIDINGTVNGMVWVMGNITKGNSIINVNSGASIKGDVGVALNGVATLNVADNTTIEGAEVGIEVRAGNLNVEGGTITSTAAAYTVTPNGSGTTTVGAAIAVAQHTTGLPINANITGGTLSGLKTISVADPQGLNYTRVVVTAKDELTEKENNVIPDDYIWMSNNNGTSTLTKIEDGEYKLIDGKDYPFMNLKSDISVPEVTYQRTFKSTQVGCHQAWYVPMDYTITAEDAKNFTFYKLHMVAGAAEAGEANPNQIYLYVTPMNVGEKLVGNRPYTVKPKAAKENYIFTAENTILYAPNNGSRLNVTTSTHSYDFFGQYKNTNYEGNKGDMYYLYQGALHPNNPITPLLPYRWNIKVSSNNINDGYSKIEFVIVEDGDATGIDGVRGFNADEVEGIYTINGLKLDEPVKGINIIKYKNGKTEKRIIK